MARKKTSDGSSGGAAQSEAQAIAEVAPRELVALDAGRIETVALGQLDVSPLNVRKDAEVGPDDELVHSIRAHGLLQPLIGYQAPAAPPPGQPGAAGAGARYLICAGQRRLLALRHVVTPDTPVPVRLVDETTAIEVSLAENLERKSMNPADELAAFKALIDTGHYDANRIADRFGFDRRTVRRRLKMAVLAPEILDALRAGTIGVAGAEAYAATDDQALQLTAFKQESRPNNYNAHSPDNIIRTYACAGLAFDSGVAKFIGGIEAYEAAGGSCAHDDAFSELFGASSAYRGARLTDAGIVQKLLERAQAEHSAEAESKAKEAFPSIHSALLAHPGQPGLAVEWCDARGNAPKPAKGMALLRTGWDAASGDYRDAGDLKKLGAAIAKAAGAVHALAEIGNDGEVAIADWGLLVDQAQRDIALAERKARGAEKRGASDTPEARAALERARRIEGKAINLYARSLIGETPGFAVVEVYPGWKGGIEIRLAERKTEELTWSDLEKLAAPFVEQATAAVDAALAAAKAAEADDETADADAEEIEAA